MASPAIETKRPADRIDYVWGFSDTEAQHWMPPGIWVAALMILLPSLLCVPVHFLLRRLMPKPVRA